MIELIWLGLMIALLVVEGLCPFHLISVWFAAGALVAMIAAMLGAELWLQVTLFLVVSIGLLVGMLPLTKKVLKPKIVATNVDSVIGTEGYVLSKIDNLEATGSVKLGGMPWTARSTTGEVIEEHTLVKVDRIEGVKAFVSKV